MPQSLFVDDERVVSALAAISPDSPGGEDPRDDERMAVIQGIRDDASVSVLGREQWTEVVEICLALLATVGKDLRVVAILAHAWERSEGATGLACAMEILSRLVAERWADLHPRRLSDRSRNWAWCVEAATVALRAGTRDYGADDAAALSFAHGRAMASAATLEALGATDLQSYVVSLANLIPHRRDAAGSATSASRPASLEPPLAVAAGHTASHVAADGDGDGDGGVAAVGAGVRADPGLPALSGDGCGLDLWETEPPDDDWATLIDIVDNRGFTSGPLLNWPSVREIARALLLSVSRDTRLFNIMLIASWRVDGLIGLADAAAVAARGLRRDWDGCHPRRLDRRHRLLGIDADDVAREIAGRFRSDAPPLSQEELAAARAAAADLSALADFVDDRMAGADAGPRDPKQYGDLLRQFAKPLAEGVAAADKANAAQDAAAARNVPSPLSERRMASLPETVATTIGPQGRKDDRSEGVNPVLLPPKSALIAMADVLREQSPLDRRVFSVTREAAMWAFDALPLAEASNRLMAPACPDSGFRERVDLLETAAAGRNAAGIRGLLSACELEMMDCPFWLDYHRIAADALAVLGGEAEGARCAVIGWMLGLVSWAPHLQTAAFSDGKALADEATRVWLAQKTASGDSGPRAKTLVEIPHDLALEQGVSLFRADHFRSGRDRFRAGIELIRYCQTHGELPLARAVSVALDEEARSRGLSDWEPALATAVLTACVALPASGEHGGDLAWGRLALIDPATALRARATPSP